MAFTKVTAAGISTGNSLTIQELNTVGVITAATVQVGSATTIHTTGIDLGSGNITSHNINSTGIITATGAVITGNLEVQGTTTTLDSLVTEVDKLEVAANNTNVAVAITQSGTGDILNLFDGSTEVFTVTDGGNVGIGTDAPAEDVHIQKSRADVLIEGTNDTVSGNVANLSLMAPYYRKVGYSIKDSDGNEDFFIGRPYGQGDDNPDLVINMTGTEKVRIRNSGNVGIGTDNPNWKTSIHGGSGGTETTLLNLHVPSYDSNTGSILRFSNSTSTSSTFGTAEIRGLRTDFATGYTDLIFTTSNGDNVTEKLRIKGGTGNIGIGTTNPGNKLHLGGTVGLGIRIQDYTSGEDGYLTIESGTNLQSNISGSGYHTWHSGGGERLRLTNSGVVGINTDASGNGANSKLVVGGRIQSNAGGYWFTSATGDEDGWHVQDIGGDLLVVESGVAERLRIASSGFISNTGADAQTPLDIVGSASSSILARPNTSSTGSEGDSSAVNNLLHLRMPYGSSPGSAANAGARVGIKMTGRNDGYFGDDGKSASIYAVSEDDSAGYNRKMGMAFYTSPFDADQVERIRITSAGTLESYSPDDTTPNIKWRSDDTNWYGALNQSVEGGTITSFLSCGGDWSANGTTYSATKALAAYPTSAIAVHNQYNSTWGSEFVFLTKAGGSTTTDGAVTERLRITSSGQLENTATSNSSSTTSNDYPALRFRNPQGSYTADNFVGGITFGKASGNGSGIRAGILGRYVSSGSVADNVGMYLSFYTSAESAGDGNEKLRLTSDGDIITPNGSAIYVSQSSFASITPSDNDWINIARVPYGAQISGQVMIAWSGIYSPACCHHGHMTFELGSSHGPTYGYQWAASLELTEAQAHNDYWFREARLITVTTGGSNWLYLQVKSFGTVTAGSFKASLLRSRYSPNATGNIQVLTPVVDNSQSGSILRHLYLTYDGSQTRVTTPHAYKIQNALGGNTYNEGNLGVGGYLQTPYQPAFFCTKSAGTPSTGNITQWDTPFVNVGSHFDTSTGRFTAPVAGVYHFHFHGFIDATVTTPTNVQVDIRKNATSLARQYTNRDSGWAGSYGPPMSITVTVIAAVNDYFDVYFSHGMHANSGYYFGGYLIG